MGIGVVLAAMQPALYLIQIYHNTFASIQGFREETVNKTRQFIQNFRFTYNT